MGIGEDIKTVLQELTTPITIHKPDGTVITGESMDYDMYYQHSTEFIRQNAYSGDFQFDSQVDFGDIVEFGSIFALVLNKKEVQFEQESVIVNCFLVQTNCFGYFARETKTRVNMENVVTWPSTVENVYGLQVDAAKMPIIEVNPNFHPANTESILYIPKYDNVKVGDRWYPDINSDEHFRVLNVNTRTYENCYKVILREDTRE